MAATFEFPALKPTDGDATPEGRFGREDDRPFVVIGAGPAGLTAGYLLAKAGRKGIVLGAGDQGGGVRGGAGGGGGRGGGVGQAPPPPRRPPASPPAPPVSSPRTRRSTISG